MYYSGLFGLALRWVGHSFNTKPGHLQLCLSFYLLLAWSSYIYHRYKLKVLSDLFWACTQQYTYMSHSLYSYMWEPFLALISPNKIPLQPPFFQTFMFIWCLSIVCEVHYIVVYYQKLVFQQILLLPWTPLQSKVGKTKVSLLVSPSENYKAGKNTQLQDFKSKICIRPLEPVSHTRNNSHCPHDCQYAGKWRQLGRWVKKHNAFLPKFICHFLH